MTSARPVSRRQVVTALATAPVATLATGLAAAPNAATFVLVHGAWHGGWCWRKLSPLLRAAGHTVFTPTLTGLGERSHLLTRDVGLDTHITDIVQVLEFEDLTNVVLVGHSYAGMVITGVAEKAAARIGQLVYLDAFLPENGKAATDYGRKFPPPTEDSWHDAPGTPDSYGVTDERDVAWMKARLTNQPRKCMTQPLQLSGNGPRPTNNTFILCTKPSRFVESAERAKRMGYRYRELLSGGHDVMVTRPGELADALSELAQPSDKRR
jgi:pimeloyl-ACP methyl ester carboxylesterase